MTQSELNRAVARATGEDVSEIAYRGFQPLELEPTEPEDLIVDWDAVEQQWYVPPAEYLTRRVA